MHFTGCGIWLAGWMGWDGMGLGDLICIAIYLFMRGAYRGAKWEYVVAFVQEHARTSWTMDAFYRWSRNEAPSFSFTAVTGRKEVQTGV